MFWSFWVNDVWGNPEDGYTVNDHTEYGEIELPDIPALQDIIDQLKKIGYVTSGDDIRIGIDEGISDDTHIFLILDDDEYPIGDLIREEK